MTFDTRPQPLPVLPEALRRQHFVHEPLDGRFRAAARLQQALWRESKGLRVGSYIGASGRRRKLGSRLDQAAITSGSNILDPRVQHLTRREIWYRERGAAMDEHRVWSNLLSSMPLCFNLFGPLKLDRQLAARTVALLFPGMAGVVSHVVFEHSPGRGDENFIGDGTAFDAFISIRREDGAKLFLAVEVKFSESMNEPTARHRPLYDEVSRSSGLYLNPDSPALRANPLEQLWRGHMLAQQVVRNGLYDAGAFILIAPSPNDEVQRAAKLYRGHLGVGEDLVAFANVPLEHFLEVVRDAGGDVEALDQRYTDWAPVHQALDDFLVDQKVKSA